MILNMSEEAALRIIRDLPVDSQAWKLMTSALGHVQTGPCRKCKGVLVHRARCSRLKFNANHDFLVHYRDTERGEWLSESS